MLSGPGSSNTLTRIAALLSSAAISVFLFQNCGKSGFKGSSSAMSGAFTSLAESDAKAGNTVFPVKANFNQISYMSCPTAAVKSGDVVDPFSDPFYHVRVGAFDNSRYATAFGVSNMSEAEIKDRLVAGIGLTSEFNDYIDQNYRNPTGEDRELAMNLAFANSPYANYQLAAGLVNSNGHRSLSEGGFGFDYNLMMGLMDAIGDSRMISSFLNQRVLADNSTIRQSFNGKLERGSQSLNANFSFGAHEVDLRDFTSELSGELVVALGYTNAGENMEITQFLSPGGTTERAITDTLYGRAYKMEFGYQWPGTSADGGGGMQMPVRFPQTIRELDMTQKDSNKQDLSVLENQDWDCFALRIVRHIDRLDPDTGGKLPYTDQIKKAIRDIRTVNNTVIKGVKAACPTQRIQDPSFPSHGITVPINQVRLEMARRFLPAELWEINTDPNFMCAVPTEHAMDRGTCYQSGDRDASKFIQYDHDMDGTKPCGPNGNECPAYVTICYRTK